ncbi:hypothetical protein F4814DRAFT_447546 [Daldinia grandis]|nr:hypothetical protein F4814DRAFT_447546 [Daldinia grandis]
MYVSYTKLNPYQFAINLTLIRSWFGSIAIAPAATAIVTAQGLIEALKKAPADIAVLVPSVIAELAQNPELLGYCATHLKLILYIGGDLPQEIGDLIATKRYIRFHPCTGAVFDEVTRNNFELVIRRDDAVTDTQTAFGILSQNKLEEHRTSDLFEPHPTISDAWRWRALHRPVIGLSMVYKNPTIPQLILALLDKSSTPNDHDLMGSLLATYRELVQQIPVPKSTVSSHTDPVDMFSTGSTSTLRTYTLRTLLDRPRVRNIFCLNRSQRGGRNIQYDRFAATGLAVAFADRVTFIQADLSNPSLGVDEGT